MMFTDKLSVFELIKAWSTEEKVLRQSREFSADMVMSTSADDGL